MQQKLRKVILFSSTLTHSQCNADNITFCNFAVNKCMNLCFVHLHLLFH